MPRRSFIMDEDMPSLADAVAELNAIPIPKSLGPRPITHFWSLSVNQNSTHWVVDNASHAIFFAITEDEAASFLAGCLAATERILRAVPPDRSDEEALTKRL